MREYEPYNLLFAEPNEQYLFFRLKGETAERNGAIGYMRADFGRNGDEFHSSWSNSQRRLKSSMFNTEFDKVINFLLDGIFGSRRDLEVFCQQHTEQNIDNRGVGFHIHTPMYSYYARCNPTRHDYDVYVFAYDNCYLIPELRGEHELPEKCYSIKPHSGTRILIQRGEGGYTRLEDKVMLYDELRHKVNVQNANLGITRGQEEAMLAGSMFGWDTPGAKPWNYNQDGTRRSLPPKKEEPER